MVVACQTGWPGVVGAVTPSPVPPGQTMSVGTEPEAHSAEPAGQLCRAVPVEDHMTLQHLHVALEPLEGRAREVHARAGSLAHGADDPSRGPDRGGGGQPAVDPQLLAGRASRAGVDEAVMAASHRGGAEARSLTRSPAGPARRVARAGGRRANTPRTRSARRSLNRATAASAAPRAGAEATSASTGGTGWPTSPSPSGDTASKRRVRAGIARCAGTKRSSTRTVLLPVAHIPDVNHTSSTSTSALGSTRKCVVSSGSTWTACTSTHSAWATPVAHSHRPVSR